MIECKTTFHRAALFAFGVLFLFSCANRADEDREVGTTGDVEYSSGWSIAIHGGAGNFDNTVYSPEQEQAYRRSLTKALEAGIQLLDGGAEALEVVTAVLVIMEDDSLFNAGRGAVMTAEGKHELDASIMDGRDKNAGAVTGLSGIKNPIIAARLVMDRSPHVFLSGDGAGEFARSFGADTVSNDYFTTVKAKAALARWQANEAEESAKRGTVGCVVLDASGHLAAGTSTGGMTGKQHGRIGDSPMIAAGTWADDASCAVSCTGHGEYFIRNAVAHNIAARMLYGGMSLDDAADVVVHEELLAMNGSGGIIAVDAHGQITMTFNTKGMFRASCQSGGDVYVAMYDNE